MMNLCERKWLCPFLRQCLVILLGTTEEIVKLSQDGLS